jgi:type IV pilus assembly protein PilF
VSSLFLVCTLMVGCASMSSSDDKKRAVLHMQIGTGFMNQGLYPQAISEMLKAERLDPSNPLILNNLGLAYYVRGRSKLAEEKFREAIRLNSQYSDAKNNLSRVLIDQERFQDAVRLLREVEGDLTYTMQDKTYSNLGMALFSMGKFVESEQALSRSLEMRRQSCATAHYYGRVLYELKRAKDSAEVLDQAVEFCRQSKFEDPLFYSAMSYFSLGNKDKSRARLEELLKDYPKSKYVAKAKGMLELLEQ